MPTLEPHLRATAHDAVVELGFTVAQARCEASRCLDCGVNTIFDGDKCILCGGCVDVCPELCLRIVSVDRLIAEPAKGEAGVAGADSAGSQRGLEAVLIDQLAGADPATASAILKDETICIRCGLCAERCPTGAITMERFVFQEKLTCKVA
jgi:ferredoxin